MLCVGLPLSQRPLGNQLWYQQLSLLTDLQLHQTFNGLEPEEAEHTDY